MPWTAADAAAHSKGLSPHQQQVWAKVANSALAACLEDGGPQGECEASAIKQANAMAKQAPAEAPMAPMREVEAIGTASRQELLIGAGVECRMFGASGLELRANGEGVGTPTIVGYAAVFDTPALIGGVRGGFFETVRAGAFRRTLRERDIKALFNHNPDWVLGRTSSKTLRLLEDRHGLRMEIDPPNTQMGRDVVEMVRRGDLSGASFAFSPQREDWRTGEHGDPDQRMLLDVDLIEVSPVTFPAYAETEVELSARATAWARRALAGGDLDDAELEAIARLLDRLRVARTTRSTSASPHPRGGRDTSAPVPAAASLSGLDAPDPDQGLPPDPYSPEAISAYLTALEASLAPPSALAAKGNE